MDENMKDTNSFQEEKSLKSHNSKHKKKSPFMRILIMVILLCVAVFGAVIISDLVTRNNNENNETQKTEYVTIRVSGELIYLDGEVVTIYELSDFYEDKMANGTIPETAFITDSLNPADYEVYNQVVSLLSKYDIDVNVDLMQAPASVDEMSASTNDEIIR
ncbi:MAG: hypothetical protein IKB72_04840 [Ruminococcus sp.]|nr:hypothetical protein [Ruminococcus sp.]